MVIQQRFLSPGREGIYASIGAGLLFGLAAPVAKSLLAVVDPWILAGLLYLGAGAGLAAYRFLSGASKARIASGSWLHLVGTVILGGGVAPVLLMTGLKAMAASNGSLLLNGEIVFTVLLAWALFKEPLGLRVGAGVTAIFIGTLALSWQGWSVGAGFGPTVAILGACLAWALDNNLTRKLSLSDPAWIASIKGLAAGSTNLLFAHFVAGRPFPPPIFSLAGLFLGFLSYGLSLTLFIVGLRHLGAVRAGAYFAVAPFFGALLSVAMGEPLTPQLLLAGTLMGAGVWLNLTEAHGGEHAHEVMEHEHSHRHEEHHAHGPVLIGKHSHIHKHEPLTHSHRHYPDLHHQHPH